MDEISSLTDRVEVLSRMGLSILDNETMGLAEQFVEDISSVGSE